ncbi:DUF397 domain-containing protein [Streptomyces sviceus]|uniref:DUF397 domain-containing protein n=1 Tax=Streptomyces sviceus TaxID=285530 RepID=UPI0033194083
MNNAESSTVAAGLAWFKSSYSGAEGGDCVEVAAATATVHVRDSKAPAGPSVTMSHDAWARFIESASSRRDV